MSGSEKTEAITWQERQANVAHVMTMLDGIGFKGDNRTSEKLDLLLGAAQLLLPGCAVKLSW